MKVIARYLLGAVLAMTMVACSNDQDFYYRDTPRVRLVGPEVWTVGSDSLTFSFVTYPADTTEKVMMVNAVIMGTPQDHDRTANIVVDNDLTTASPQQYSLPATVTIPAGKTSAAFPVTLRRDASLQQQPVRLYIKVAPSDELKEFFGEYSNTKYRFMIANAGGINEFDTDKLSWGELMNLRIKFQNALQDYNNAHPGNPLKDENGVLVEF